MQWVHTPNKQENNWISVNLPGGGQAYQVVSAANVVAKQEPEPSNSRRQMRIAGLPDDEAAKKRELRLLKNRY